MENLKKLKAKTNVSSLDLISSERKKADVTRVDRKSYEKSYDPSDEVPAFSYRKDRIHKTYRIRRKIIDAIEAYAKFSGKTNTQIVEDALTVYLRILRAKQVKKVK